MVFSTSGIGSLVIDVGIVIVILVVLKMLKIPIVVDPFGEKSVHLRNEQSKDKDRIFNKFWLKTGREWKKEIIDKEVKKGLQEIKIVAGEIYEGTRETIRYCLEEKRMKVFIVAEQGLKCPTEDLKEFIANPNFKLRISDKRPEHHKTIIGQNILLEEYHTRHDPYKKALGIENAYADVLEYHNDIFNSIFRDAQEIKSDLDLDEKTVCIFKPGK